METTHRPIKLERKTIITHVAVWLLLYLVPVILYAQDTEVGWRFPASSVMMLTTILITFYANFLWAIDRLYYRRHVVLFLLFNIVLFALLRDLRNQMTHYLEEVMGNVRPHNIKSTTKLLMWIFNDMVFSIMAVGISFAFRYGMMVSDMEIERKRVENESLSSQLSLLRYQIQPHFFFNTLNNIYAMIGVSPRDAQKAVHSLSKLMRYVLYDSMETYVDVGREADFLKNYSSLMQIRLNSNSHVVMDFPENIGTAYIPSLLLVPLVENAFKHGADINGHSDISSAMSIKDGRLTFSISNTVFTDGENDKNHSGIGISNLRKRLDLLFGQDYTFTTEVTADNKYVATMIIPVKKTHQENKEIGKQATT